MQKRSRVIRRGIFFVLQCVQFLLQAGQRCTDGQLLGTHGLAFAAAHTVQGLLAVREALENYTELMHHPERISDFCESDDGFHELLMSTLPNKYLRSAYDRITGLNTRFRIMTGKVSMINQEQTCEEHLEILDAALAGDWDRAADSLQHHLELARDKAEGVIKVIRLW